jgi:hypothetical protein
MKDADIRSSRVSGLESILLRMNERVKAIGILASSYGSLERQVEKALAGISPERIVSISYSTSRIFTVWFSTTR